MTLQRARELRPVAWCGVIAATAMLFPAAAGATANDGLPKILLHLKPVTTKSQCATGFGDCRDAVTEGLVSTTGDRHTYFALVVGAPGIMPSLAAVGFGIQYDTGCPGDRLNQDRVDIVSWMPCATLEFPTPSPAWPAPGSGNLVTWDAVNACQTGESATVGYFYLACYDAPDVLDLVPRLPMDNAAVMATCGAVEYSIPPASLGAVAFSAGGATPGCNPCDAPCPTPAVRPGCPPPPPDTTPPAAVTDLLVTNASGTSITLRWTATGDDGTSGGPAASYQLKRSLNPITAANFGSGTSVPTGTPGAPGTLESKTVTGLSSNTTYYFAIKVLDEVPNASAISNVVSQATGAPPPDVTPPAAVTTLTVVSTSLAGAVVRWQAPGDDGFSNGPAAGYDFRYALTPITEANFADALQVANEPPPNQPTSFQEFNVSGLATGATWYIAMKSRDEVPNVSALSNVVAATIPGTPAQQNAATSLLLHLEPVGLNTCATGRLFDCRDARTAGRLFPSAYQVYLLAGQYAELGGIECGLTYSGGAADGVDDQSGVDIHGWTLCADLQFATPSPAWPAPGSGNLMTWQTAHCQFPNTAVVGYFYAAAYSADEMRLTVRPVSGQASVATCSSAETTLPPDALGSARFTIDGTVAGVNPCYRGVVTSIRPSTWTRIKVLGGQAAAGRTE
jgi:hypothetical protein